MENHGVTSYCSYYIVWRGRGIRVRCHAPKLLKRGQPRMSIRSYSGTCTAQKSSILDDALIRVVARKPWPRPKFSISRRATPHRDDYIDLRQNLGRKMIRMRGNQYCLSRENTAGRQ